MPIRVLPRPLLAIGITHKRDKVLRPLATPLLPLALRIRNDRFWLEADARECSPARNVDDETDHQGTDTK